MSRNFIFVLLLIGLLASCDEATINKKQAIDNNQYLAMGKDSDGCTRYRLQSTTQMSVQVIVYKTIDGGYTPNKNNSVCQ